MLNEGNYLLLQTQPWSELKPRFDVILYLDVPREVLRTRFLNRWREHGLSPLQAEARADGNDMKNVEIVNSLFGRADFFVKEDS